METEAVDTTGTTMVMETEAAETMEMVMATETPTRSQRTLN